MTLKRNVNGVDVDLSPAEEAAQLAEWAASDTAPPSSILRTFVFFNRWTTSERNALHRRSMTADATGDLLSDATNTYDRQGSVNVTAANTIAFMDLCVTASVLTTPRRNLILNLRQPSP